MSADFWAGYISGAAGIIIGNPLDLIKTRLQAGDSSVNATSAESLRGTFDRVGTLVRGRFEFISLALFWFSYAVLIILTLISSIFHQKSWGNKSYSDEQFYLNLPCIPRLFGLERKFPSRNLQIRILGKLEV